jgi:hypothetical protein
MLGSGGQATVFAGTWHSKTAAFKFMPLNVKFISKVGIYKNLVDDEF